MRIQRTKNLLVFSAMIFALVFTAESSFAAKVCLLDGFGDYWELKGGKIDKKAYTVKYFDQIGCIVGGYADATLTDSGTVTLGIFTAHDNNCPAISWTAITDVDFAGSGIYDVLGDGTFEGSFTLTPVNCSSLPPSKPEKE